MNTANFSSLLLLPFHTRLFRNLNTMEPAEYYDSVDLHIRWSDRQDLILRVSPEETIYTIKEKVAILVFGILYIKTNIIYALDTTII